MPSDTPPTSAASFVRVLHTPAEVKAASREARADYERRIAGRYVVPDEWLDRWWPHA